MREGGDANVADPAASSLPRRHPAASSLPQRHPAASSLCCRKMAPCPHRLRHRHRLLPFQTHVCVYMRRSLIDVDAHSCARVVVQAARGGRLYECGEDVTCPKVFKISTCTYVKVKEKSGLTICPSMFVSCASDVDVPLDRKRLLVLFVGESMFRPHSGSKFVCVIVGVHASTTAQIIVPVTSISAIDDSGPSKYDDDLRRFNSTLVIHYQVRDEVRGMHVMLY